MSARNEEAIAVLKDSTGQPVALQGVSVRGSLSETLASIQVEQRYRNPSQHNIEAVYTFPLPIGAVLLDMEVEIADQKLSGQIVEKKTAEQRYEDAITDGDSVVMVQALGNGLYAMNVGNLLGGESAVIRYRYALTLSWQGDHLRLTIPTSIAPRYGDAVASGLEPWQVPTSSLIVEYPFELSVSIEGKLAEVAIASPTHPISLTRTECGVNVTLAHPATLDRDFVLTAKSKANLENTCLLVNDGAQKVMLVSLRIPPVLAAIRAPLCIKIVIDCSFSMAGVSIAQARKAALAILDLLKPEDTFNITLFGDYHEHLFDLMVPANPIFIEAARESLQRLDASYGGTEIGKALSAAYKLSGTPGMGFFDWLAEKQDNETSPAPAVLLITDGEVWDIKNVLHQAVKSRHRVFTVGVGMAVAESFVTELAKATGAACELVSPQEGMADKVLAQFHRLSQPLVGRGEMVWGTLPLWQTPMPAVLFAGDTIHVYAGFNHAPPASILATVPDRHGGTIQLEAFTTPVDLPDIPRLAAHARIAFSNDAEEQLRLAIAYQLLTAHTHCLVVAERVEKAAGLPELHAIPQMLAAGWGGTGSSVDAGPVAMFRRCAPSPSADLAHAVPAVMRLRSSQTSRGEGAAKGRHHIPAFLRLFMNTENEADAASVVRKRTQRNKSTLAQVQALTPLAFIERLNATLQGFLQVHILPSTLDELKAFGLPADIVDALGCWIESGWDHPTIVTAFLLALSESSLTKYFKREVRRLIAIERKRQALDPRLQQWCADALSGVEQESWHWEGRITPVSTGTISRLGVESDSSPGC